VVVGDTGSAEWLRRASSDEMTQSPHSSNSSREEIRSRTDIVALVGRYVPLRRAGRSMIACCPFHKEKTPSFNVSEEKQLYHCFGCKASGDVFSFYQQIEGVSFSEAMRALGEAAGVESESHSNPSEYAERARAKDMTERLYAACEAAAAFFQIQLNCCPSAAMSVIERGISDAVAAEFRLGYAPGEWSALTTHLSQRGISPADAELAGLIIPRKTNGYYDRFRHRLMFPIADRTGRVVAFSGRILPRPADMPDGIVPEDAGKYSNSPETPIYKKSDLLFGLNLARPAIRQNAHAILVEGNFDVVAMHQAGFANTVAPLGTSFTESQAKLLRRSAETVTIVFDGDDAGRKAVRAAYTHCAKVGLSARVVTLPNGMDPDEMLRAAGGYQAFAERIKYAPSIVEWVILDTADDCGPDISERMSSIKELAVMFGSISDKLERSIYEEMIARSFCVSVGKVRVGMGW
jgi:DNA primase